MRARPWPTGKAFLATAAVAAAVAFTVYVLRSAWDLWGEMQWVARQIAVGEAFMAGLSGEQLDHWVGWAETQMETAARDGLRKDLGTGALPNELKGLDLLKCRIESNAVFFV